MNRLTSLLGIQHPIVQGPFGGGLSSVELAATVADAGGLGSFGAHHLGVPEIAQVAARLRRATDRSFALNLWVSTHDLPEAEMTRGRFEAAVARLAPLYEEVGATPPPFPERFAPTFEAQVEAVLEARPPAFSFVFGIPSEPVLDELRARGILTIGTATTADEAVALDDAGVDAIVASGFEAGGHRGAFMKPAEESLVGTLSLVATVVSEVSAPVIAAGGIADARGVAAALALGAEGVQVGTAFLATDESGTTREHRLALRDGRLHTTRLTRSFSGRLARGIPTRLMDDIEREGAVEPYPYQGYLLKPVLAAARAQGNVDLVSLWAGQSAALIEHTRAAELFDSLVAGTELPHLTPTPSPDHERNTR